MRDISIAVVQMKPVLGSVEDNLIRMSDQIRKIASRQKVDLILFPELITSGYELGVKFTQVAQTVPGPAANLLAQRAQEYGTHIAFGMVVKERIESILYNAAILIGRDGEIIGQYHKTHLRGEERMAFREGFRLPTFDTEFGTVGLMIGWDLAFPEVARSMVMEGAELICTLGNWEKEEIEGWKTLVKARAYENACFVVGANRVGEDVTMTFGGESMIVNPRGLVLNSLAGEREIIAASEKPTTKAAENKESEKKGPDVVEDQPKVEEKKFDDKKTPKREFVEDFFVTKIDLDEVRDRREQVQTLQARQPAIYRAVVRKY